MDIIFLPTDITSCRWILSSATRYYYLTTVPAHAFSNRQRQTETAASSGILERSVGTHAPAR
jgi:hypothetical protein